MASSAPCQYLMPIDAACRAANLTACTSEGVCGCTNVRLRCPHGCDVQLHKLLLPMQTSIAACATAADCNGADSSSVCSQGRCRCAPGLGMWNCSFQNGAMPTSTADRRFGEGVYARYYRNMSSIARKTPDSEADGRKERGTSLSGPGSNAEETVGVRTVLPVLLALLKVRTMIDVPCGDFNYMRAVLNANATPHGIAYHGMDIVTTLVQQLEATFGTASASHKMRHHISFSRFDLASEYLWPVDLVIVRDILFHFTAERANDVLRRVGESGCRFALVTYFPRVHNNVAARKYQAGKGFSSYASWNLEQAPFALPPPLLSIGWDGARADRVVGLWPCGSLQVSSG